MQGNRSSFTRSALLAAAVAAALALAACKQDDHTAPQTGAVQPDGNPAVAEPATPAGNASGTAAAGTTDGEASVAGTDTPRPENAGTMATSGTGAIAQLESKSDSSVTGRLLLTADTGGVRVSGQIVGLSPNGEHGFHVHETGDCSAPDASSAGGHFNPTNQPHGNPTAPDGHHAGDIPSVVADAQGNATVDVVVPGITLGSGAINDAMGRALVVHEKRDDYATQPSGDSGGRVACGKISAG